VKGAFGRADDDALVGIERAAHSGRRITARRARKQKRARHSARGWSIGALTVTPVIAVVAVIVVLAGVAGAAIALGGRHSRRRASATQTSTRPTASTTKPRPTTSPAVNGVYARFTDDVGTVHYMYCTTAAGCGLLDVAKNGTSTISVMARNGAFHDVKRVVIKHDPCIDIVRNAQRVGVPGDLAAVTTTDLRNAGSQLIKGIRAPARVVGDISVHFDHPVLEGCDFSGTPDFTRRVSSPVTEYVPTR